jgi:DNA polymerase-3 subunit beta
MKLIVLQEKFKKGLQYADKILTKSSSIFVLNNIFLKTEKNFLNILATNLETGLKWWTLSKIQKEGEVLVPLKPLLNFVSFLPNKPILIEKKENVLYLECENFKTQIKLQQTEELPFASKIDHSNNYLEIETNVFINSLSQVIEFVSLSQTKPEITGVFLSADKNSIKIATTDSFRLAEKTITNEKNNFIFNNPKEDFICILPQQTVKELINILDVQNGKTKIYFFENQIVFETSMQEINHPEIQFTSKLIEGEYPQYEEIIPKEFNTEAIVLKNDVLKHLKVASIFCGKINEIKLTLDTKKQEITFIGNNPEVGEHQSSLQAKIKGENIDISFNHRFLIGGITNIEQQEIFLGFNKEDKPSVLKALKDSSFIYVVMPIKN